MRRCAVGYSTAASIFMVDIKDDAGKIIIIETSLLTPHGMASHRTWHHTLFGITLYMASKFMSSHHMALQFTWRHNLHGITPYMASQFIWHLNL
jgi:hypothetical protein